jgi:phosphonate transport system substrate-binding protein
MSPRMALDAIASGKLEVFAQQAWADGTVGYRSQLVVRSDSPLRTINDLVASPGRYRYGHAERHSTSGYVVPEQLFARHKMSSPLHFTRMVEGTHQSNFIDLANGELDVVAGNSSRLRKFAEKYSEDAKRLRVIWESEPIPDVMWVMRKDVSPAQRQQIRAAVFGYAKGPRAKEQLAILKKIYDLSGFIPASNSTLWPMLEWSRMADRGSAERAQFASPADKEKRLAEVDRLYAEMAKAIGVR